MSNIMPTKRFISLICLGFGSLAIAGSLDAAEAVPGPRWFQVEMTVFSHENSNLEMEIWSSDKLSLGFPERLRTLTSLTDFLQLNDWTWLTGPAGSPADTSSAGIVSPATPDANISAAATPVPALVGPKPFAPGDSFQLPDFAREPFLALPESDHDFVGSNRALSQSSAYRILFHNAWRQPMTRRNTAPAIAINGGRAFNGRSELEGSVSLYFNNAEDRVVFDGNIWLSSFSTVAGSESGWILPALPAALTGQDAGAPTAGDVVATEYFVNRILQLRQTRDMRSGEFHYIDHPAMGILVQITPYVVPELPVPEPGTFVAPLLPQ